MTGGAGVVLTSEYFRRNMFSKNWQQLQSNKRRVFMSLVSFVAVNKKAKEASRNVVMFHTLFVFYYWP